jgi:NADPH-dependent glutamate synthase beta subunit-like oxidoreductase
VQIPGEKFGTNVQLKELYKRFEALDQFQGSARPRTAGTEDNKAYIENAIAFLRKMSMGLTQCQ